MRNIVDNARLGVSNLWPPHNQQLAHQTGNNKASSNNAPPQHPLPLETFNGKTDKQSEDFGKWLMLWSTPTSPALSVNGGVKDYGMERDA